MSSWPYPHFLPFRGARPSCPWCSSLFDFGEEPTCGCVDAEEAEEPGCACCDDRSSYSTWLDFEHGWEEEFGYEMYTNGRDYDAEYHAEDSYAWAYSEWCVPGWDRRREKDDYVAWRSAFPELAWRDEGEEPCVLRLPVCPELAEPWEKWETVAEAIGF